MTFRDYRIGFSGTDLISRTQFEYYPELKYRMPQALAHALYRLEEVQGEINDMELSEEVRRIARKRRHILNGCIANLCIACWIGTGRCSSRSACTSDLCI